MKGKKNISSLKQIKKMSLTRGTIYFDVFNQGRHIYTFENICKEDTNIALGDGAVKIFICKEIR